jgi:Domain of unknown function (DUF4288)
MWFAASVIMYVQFKDGAQNKYPIWENIILIEATSDKEALEKAEKRGREDEGDSEGSFHWEERPARWVFGGIRKLLKCKDADNRPTDGTEITYSQMQVATEEAFNKLINGEAVTITYEE